jgi:phage terminase Nu1 subunit (DNA packaging protein)
MSNTKKGKTVREIAEFFGIHHMTVREWIKQGCPYLQAGRHGGGEGKEWLLDPYEVHKWKVEKEVRKAVGNSDIADLDESKRRKVAAEAALVELELMREQGLLVEIDKVTSKLNDELVNFRAKMLSIPTKVVSQVYAAKSKDEIREILDLSIHEALNEISIASAEAADDDTDEENTSDVSVSTKATAEIND